MNASYTAERYITFFAVVIFVVRFVVALLVLCILNYKTQKKSHNNSFKNYEIIYEKILHKNFDMIFEKFNAFAIWTYVYFYNSTLPTTNFGLNTINSIHEVCVNTSKSFNLTLIKNLINFIAINFVIL